MTSAADEARRWEISQRWNGDTGAAGVRLHELREKRRWLREPVERLSFDVEIHSAVLRETTEELTMLERKIAMDGATPDSGLDRRAKEQSIRRQGEKLTELRKRLGDQQAELAAIDGEIAELEFFFGQRRNR